MLLMFVEMTGVCIDYCLSATILTIYTQRTLDAKSGYSQNIEALFSNHPIQDVLPDSETISKCEMKILVPL